MGYFDGNLSSESSYLIENKILFPAYVCYFPATEILFKTFFESYPTQLGFGEEITTLDEALDGKVFHAYYPNTKVFYDCTGLQNHLRYPQLRRRFGKAYETNDNPR
jgi:hypothetical protein